MTGGAQRKGGSAIAAARMLRQWRQRDRAMSAAAVALAAASAAVAAAQSVLDSGKCKDCLQRSLLNL